MGKEGSWKKREAGKREKLGSYEAGKLGSWEAKKCLWHGVPFLVLSALRHIREKNGREEAEKHFEERNALLFFTLPGTLFILFLLSNSLFSRRGIFSLALPFFLRFCVAGKVSLKIFELCDHIDTTQ